MANLRAANSSEDESEQFQRMLLVTRSECSSPQKHLSSRWTFSSGRPAATRTRRGRRRRKHQSAGSLRPGTRSGFDFLFQNWPLLRNSDLSFESFARNLGMFPGCVLFLMAFLCGHTVVVRGGCSLSPGV